MTEEATRTKGIVLETNKLNKGKLELRIDQQMIEQKDKQVHWTPKAY